MALPHVFATQAAGNVPASYLDDNFNALGLSTGVLYAQGATTLAGSFVVGKQYQIASIGTTDFTLIGASANTVGVVFTATGLGAGTGTAYLLRTVQSKLQESVSVLDFGADPTGTTDSTSAIQAAVTSAAGKTLVINPGNYLISSTIVISTPSTSITAYAASFTWSGVAPGSLTPMVKIGNASATTESQCSFFRLVGLRLNANNVSNLHGFYFTTSRYSAFEDLRVENALGTGAYAYYCSGDDTHSLNCAQNIFLNCSCEQTYNGWYIGSTNGAVTTQNSFINLGMVFLRSVGVLFDKPCDTNFFYNLNIDFNPTGGPFTGVIFNNSTSVDNDVQLIKIDGLVISGSGVGATSTGIVFNYCYNIVISGFEFALNGGTFTEYTIGGPANIVSFTLQKLSAPLLTYNKTPLSTASAGANAGTSPPTPVISGNNFLSGKVTFGTGTTPSAGTLATVTFPTALDVGPTAVMLTPINGASAALNLVPAGVLATSFNVFANTAPAASQSNTTYGFYYQVVT